MPLLYVAHMAINGCAILDPLKPNPDVLRIFFGGAKPVVKIDRGGVAILKGQVSLGRNRVEIEKFAFEDHIRRDKGAPICQSVPCVATFVGGTYKGKSSHNRPYDEVKQAKHPKETTSRHKHADHPE